MSQISNVTVHKLGGSCLIDEKSFEKILTIVDNYKNGGLILVASAMQGVTNQLIKFMQDCNTHSIKPEDVIKELKDKHLKIAGEVIKDEANLNLVSSFLSDLSTQLKEALTKIYDLCLINPQLTDQVIAFGERFSTSILYYYLKSKGHPVRFFQADNLIITDSNYTNALPKLDKTKKLIESQLIPVIKNGEIPVVTGFLAKSEDGFVTTLGRGGSDFTATLIAYSIVESFKQTKVILWKDVDGLLTANPKYVPNAKLIKNISYREAKELAFFGSKIIHPMCLIPLEEKKIPMEIRNFSKPLSSDYTTFTTERQVKRDIVKALTAKEDVALITVEGA
ncbi:MAG: aspartate kinase, partial [Candidatus Odinarchaeota archaeon]